MRKHLKLLLLLLTLTALLIIPYLVFAADVPAQANSNSMLKSLTAVAGGGGYITDQSQSDLMTVVGLIINAALGLLGAIFIIIMVIAGYNWMTASGNEQKVEKAQAKIRQAIIGLIITLSSWAIWQFILQYFISK